MNPLQNASTFLIQTLFDFYLLVLLLRFILQYLRVDYYNPFTQFVVKATNPVVTPVRRFVPGWWGLDMATILLVVGFTFFKIILLTAILAHKVPTMGGLMVWSLGSIIALTIKLFFYALIINIVLSWVAPMSRSPVSAILYRLTEPLLRPVRRLIPPLGGFDISPIPVMIFLELLTILIAEPLIQRGAILAIR